MVLPPSLEVASRRAPEALEKSPPETRQALEALEKLWSVVRRTLEKLWLVPDKMQSVTSHQFLLGVLV